MEDDDDDDDDDDHMKKNKMRGFVARIGELYI